MEKEWTQYLRKRHHCCERKRRDNGMEMNVWMGFDREEWSSTVDGRKLKAMTMTATATKEMMIVITMKKARRIR